MAISVLEEAREAFDTSRRSDEPGGCCEDGLEEHGEEAAAIAVPAPEVVLPPPP